MALTARKSPQQYESRSSSVNTGSLQFRGLGWERKKVDELATIVRCIRKVAKQWKTAVDLEAHGQILHMLPTSEYQLSLLIFGNDKLKLELYKEAQANEKFIRLFGGSRG